MGRPALRARGPGPLPILLLAAATTVTLAGCSLFGLSLPDLPSPDASATPPDLGTPAPSGSDEAARIDDVESGFSLQLPAGWRSLEAGDEGWVAVYGTHGTGPERDVANGTIQDYAVPLPQNDDRSLNLAVYVRPVPAETTLEKVADGYESTLRSAQHVTKIERSQAALAAGPSILLSGLRPGSAAKAPDDRLEAYIVVHGARAYYLVFVCSESNADRSAPIFRTAADSIRFT